MMIPANTIQPTVQSVSPLQGLAALFQHVGITPTFSQGLLGMMGEKPGAGVQQGESGALSGGSMDDAYLKAFMGGQQAPGLGGQLLGSFGQTAQGPQMDGSAGSTTGDGGFLGMLGSLGSLFE